MEAHSIYLKYPRHIVLITNLHSLGIYAIGIYLVAGLTGWLLIPWIAYLLFLEIRLLSTGCTHCFYYDRTCAFGRGKISALFFRKKDPAGFSQRCFTWKNMIPDLLVSFIPLSTGIYWLIVDFNWIVLSLLILLLFLSSTGNAFVRGKLACLHCRQTETGCPAYELFNK